MERMFDKQDSSRRRKAAGSSGPAFASLTAGLMARKGEAVPAPAHLDGVSIHSHGVQREAEKVAERSLADTAREEQLTEGLAGARAPKAAPQQAESEAAVQAPQPAFEPPVESAPGLHAPDTAPFHRAREVPPPAPPTHHEPKPVSEEVLRRRAARRATAAAGDCCALPLPRAVTETLPPGPYAKVTTRLDKERVRKLKILAARMGTTNQKVLLAALDHYLDFACDVLASECPCLARSMNEDV